MDLFLSLFLKIIPLYSLILVGFLAGKLLRVKKESIAGLLIYVITPAVVFIGMMEAELTMSLFALPIIIYFLLLVFCCVYFYLSKFWWKDSTRNLMAFSASTANVGYFGLPVVLAVLGENALPIVVMFLFGTIFFEATIGYYIFARARYGMKDAIIKLLKLPALYAFVFGVILNLIGAAVLDFVPVRDVLYLLKGAYAPLGMMLIGLGLSGVALRHVDYKFIGVALFHKFLIWPIAIQAIIWMDKLYLHIFDDPLIYAVLTIESLVPLAANSVAFASEFKAHPEKASIAVLVSSIVGMVLLPLGVMVLGV